jgi:anthranilate phosphoribosyltransferase
MSGQLAPEVSGGASAPSVTWSDVLNRLVAGERLQTDEAASIMRDVLAGHAAAVHLSAFLVLLRARGETVEEVSGFLQAIRDVALHVHVTEEERQAVVDTCGTGGDRSGTINVSTTASFVVAAAGVPIAKHGNRAASSKSGAADVLEALGAVIDLGPEQVAECIREAGIGFCVAPRFHPAFRFVGPIRKELGVPTIMNILGPLSNPAGATRQVIGVGIPEFAPLIVEVLKTRGAERVMVVHGDDGLDEFTNTGPSKVWELRDGEVRSHVVDPETLRIPLTTLPELCGGDPAFNADRTRRILEGEPGPQSDFVALNAAAGLLVGGKVDDLAAGYELARSLISDGSAAKCLQRFIETTQRLGA